MRVLALAIVAWLIAAPVAAQAPVLTIESPPELAAARARLDAVDLRPLVDIVGRVGLAAPGPPIRVVLAAEGSSWAEQVPPWTAGFATSDSGLIVLFPSRSPVYPLDTLEDVLRHEVAHVLISRAAGGRAVPRWFHEGLAVTVERGWGLEDRSRLAWELMLGPRLTLHEIDDLFAGGQSAQIRGYSLAPAVMRDLISEHGATAPAAVLHHLANGETFDEAIASVAFRSVGAIEAEFWKRQRTWTLWVPMLTSTTVVWLVVMGLAALAVRRRHVRAAEIRRRWASEEVEVESRDDVP